MSSMKARIFFSRTILLIVILMMGCSKEEPEPVIDTSTKPTVITQDATDVSLVGATLHGDVTNDGELSITDKGFYLSTTSPPTETDTKISKGPGDTVFSYDFTEATPGTTYYYRAYATNSKGTSTGAIKVFEINSVAAPTVLTLDANNINKVGATLNGDITDDGGLSISDKGFYLSTTPTPTASDTKISKGAGNESFSHDFSGGTPGTAYYYTAYAENSKGVSIGAIKDFFTDEDVIEIATKDVSAITTSSAVCGAIITKGVVIKERGLLVLKGSSSPAIDAYDYKIVDDSGNLDFSLTINNLTSNTEYQVISYAINGEDAVYQGIVKSFSTLEKATLTMGSYSSLTTTSFDVEFSFIANGETISEAGVCYSTSENPTVDDNKIITTGGIIPLTGLTENTKYYVRGYIITDSGVRYSSSVMPWTYAFTDIDGNGYHTVDINGQIWVVENFKSTHYKNGELISNVTDQTEWLNLLTGAICWYNNDKAQHHDTYGALYNWYAVNDSRGLAPEGWHVATDEEWTALKSYLGDNAGGKIKSTTSDWRPPNTGANNLSGLTVLPTGNRELKFQDLRDYGAFWCATPAPLGAWVKYVAYNSNILYDHMASYEIAGYSVRLIKDQPNQLKNGSVPESANRQPANLKAGFLHSNY